MSRIPMTKSGKVALQEELTYLKTKGRAEVTAAIAEARAHGDLKENAEYAAAREQQSFMEGRIKEIEGKLSHAQVIDVTTLDNSGKVIFGATVTVMNLENDTESTYQIVGDDEADPQANKISFNSPIAKGLIGKSEGDEVEIRTPNGPVEYEIITVEYC